MLSRLSIQKVFFIAHDDSVSSSQAGRLKWFFRSKPVLLKIFWIYVKSFQIVNLYVMHLFNILLAVQPFLLRNKNWPCDCIYIVYLFLVKILRLNCTTIIHIRQLTLILPALCTIAHREQIHSIHKHSISSMLSLIVIILHLIWFVHAQVNMQSFMRYSMKRDVLIIVVKRIKKELVPIFT